MTATAGPAEGGAPLRSADRGGPVVGRLTLVLRDPDTERVFLLAAAVAGIAGASGMAGELHTAPGGLAVTVEGEAECVADLLAGVVPALPGARVEAAADGRSTVVTVTGLPGPPPGGRPPAGTGRESSRCSPNAP